MIRFPYGIADFYRLRTEGYLYVDRTAFLRAVEDLGPVLLFLRPRRFGKSLWLQTLRNYYSVLRAAEHERLFGGLDIWREPTPRRGGYFVLHWNFSLVDPRGTVEEIAERLREHVSGRVRDFLQEHREHLGTAVEIGGGPADVLGSLLSAVSQTPYPLYLLIDEYDNFMNEVVVRSVDAYRALVEADGPFKALFKAVKDGTEGRGLERVFMTGVSPAVLNDLSSGFNIARDVSRHPWLEKLCGFTAEEVEGILEKMIAAGSLTGESKAEVSQTLHDWYNGYRFASGETAVLNPTSCLYLLQSYQELGTYPESLQDENLAIDREKLRFLAQSPATREVIEKLAEGDGTIAVAQLERSFSMRDLASRIGQERGKAASFLYYLGLLTQVSGAPSWRLGIPNLVMRKIFLERLLEIYLPQPEASDEARQLARRFFDDDELQPLLEFIERKLFPVLSNRDHAGLTELVLKALLLAILFDDQRYAVFSELEIGHGYSDLVLLRRPDLRTGNTFDLLIELKLVPLAKTGLTGAELAELAEEAVRALPPVAAAFDAAREQIGRYRRALIERFGEAALDLRCHAVVAVGLERVLGE